MNKSTRLEQIDGYFHGIHFHVKPTPIAIEEIEQEMNDMLKEWYRENKKEASDPPQVVIDWLLEKHEVKDLSDEDAQAIVDYISASKAWKKDVEFRAKYAKTMATYCMAFDSEPPADIWKDRMLEFSTIRTAWDFFCERRAIPSSGR